MRPKVIQQGLFGDDMEIKNKNRKRGSSFNARVFEQLKDIIKWYTISNCNDRELFISMMKAKMLIKEKEDLLAKKRRHD